MAGAMQTRDEARSGGFTLLELLLVTLLLGLLFGIGLGVLSSLDLGKRAAVGSVQNVVRAARNSAVARNAPASVRLDSKEGWIRARAEQVVGTWHFEGETDGGAFGLTGDNQGASFAGDGYIGQALEFGGSPAGATWVVGVQDDPGFDLSQGFTIDVALRAEGKGSGRALNLGNVLGLEITSANSLRAWFLPTAFDKAGTASPAGRTSAESAPGTFTRGRWFRARVTYDLRFLRLFVDGVEVARAEEAGPVWRPEGPLWISDPKAGFPGSIDELTVAAVTSGSQLRLPETVKLASDAPAEIRFAAGGALDREFHDGPIAFHLEYQDGTRPLLRVGSYGTVE